MNAKPSIKRAMKVEESARDNKYRWNRVFFGVRSRILLSYIVLRAFSTILSIPVIRQVLCVRLERQIEKSLLPEMKEFKRVVNGRNPTTGKPVGDDLMASFDKYLSRNVRNCDIMSENNENIYKFQKTVVFSQEEPFVKALLWTK